MIVSGPLRPAWRCAGQATRRWLAARPRVQRHYTPKHACWLDQAKPFFSILSRRLLRRGKFTSRRGLADKIEDLVVVHNRTAKPYRWTYNGRPHKGECGDFVFGPVV